MVKNFIIIETDPVVCLDVEGMLTDRYPGCHIVSGPSLEDIGAAIHKCGPGTTLFVKSTLIVENDDLHRVAANAATRGSQIVVIGARMDFGFPATVLELPFTMDMVIAAVGRGTGDANADLTP